MQLRSNVYMQAKACQHATISAALVSTRLPELEFGFLQEASSFRPDDFDGFRWYLDFQQVPRTICGGSTMLSTYVQVLSPATACLPCVL